MENNQVLLPALASPGELITFYACDNGALRSAALASTAQLLSSREGATVPVLMVDWDTESPSLHHLFHDHGSHPGLLEFFDACREQMRSLRRGHETNDASLAERVLDQVPWQQYVRRIDPARPLYLMRAGRFDSDYGERVATLDWQGLFNACPVLFRCFAERLVRFFRFVLVDARGGRSAQASICTALLPRKMVGLFTPAQASLDAMASTVRRAIDYRCSNPDAQRPLLFYPLPAGVDSTDAARRATWRRGDPARGVAGYQAALEQLMRDCYGRTHASLESYLDEIQLQHSHVVPANNACRDRFSLNRAYEGLLTWMADGRFPWQSRTEVALADAIDMARCEADLGSASGIPLAASLHQLGRLHMREGLSHQSLAAFEEATVLRQRLLGDDHADTRASRAGMAEQLRQLGKLAEARFLYELLESDGLRLLGGQHPDTLLARAGLAATLSLQGEAEAAMSVHADVIVGLEAQFGPEHGATLAARFARAETLARCGDLDAAMAQLHQVLAARQRLFGPEHGATLACMHQMAVVLCHQGELPAARRLQEQVLESSEHQHGVLHPATMRERAALLEIVAEQGDHAAQVRLRKLLVPRADEGAPVVPLRPLTPFTGAPGIRAAIAAARSSSQLASMEQQVERLRCHIEAHDLADARSLAECLRRPLLARGVFHGLRKRGLQLIKQLYQIQGDKDALLALQEEEVAALEGALGDAQSGQR